MTVEEAKEFAAKWESDITSARDTALAGRDKALSKARAQAGASGVRKGTQSWDTMMKQATSEYDAIMQGLDAERLSLDAYNASLAGMPTGTTGGEAPGPSGSPGDTDNTDVGLGQAGTGGNLSGTPAGDFAAGFAVETALETVGTVAAQAGFSIAGPMGAVVGLGLPGVVAGFKNDELESPFSASSPLAALTDLAEIAFAATTNLTFDEVVNTYDVVASHIDQGLNVGSARAARQSDIQAEENASQGYSDPTGSGSDMGGLDNESTNTDANTAAGEQSDAQAEENEAQRGGMGGMGGAGDSDSGGSEGTGGADSGNEGSGGETEGSCFTAGTLVLLTNGQVRRIEEVRIGDVLVGEGGAGNVVMAYDRPKLGSRKLYSINGSEPFVTSEHPFMTTEGWKSFDPKATASEEGILIETTELGLEDVLLKFNATEYIRSLMAVSADPNTKLYNFKLEGNHTYYANGFLVHNKI